MNNDMACRVAVIGGGIVGMTLAHALIERSFNVVIYEQSTSLRVGVGGLQANEAAVRALKLCSKHCYEAFKECAVVHYQRRPELAFKITSSNNDQPVEALSYSENGNMSRANFTEALARRMPEEVWRYGKKLITLNEVPDAPVELHFGDGSTATADLVISCDGINSKVRNTVVGRSVDAEFTHMSLVRGLVSIKQVSAIIGPDLAQGPHLTVGHRDGYVFAPVSDKFSLFGYVLQHPDLWPHFPQMVAKITKTELLDRSRQLHTGDQFHALLQLFPEELEVWAIYGILTPLSTWSRGRIAIMGDAAHACGPFLGAGAAVGYEDVAVLAELLVAARAQHGGSISYPVLERLLSVYSQARIHAGDEIVQSTYQAGKVLTGMKPFEEAGEELKRRLQAMYDKQVGNMIEEALKIFRHNNSRNGEDLAVGV